MLRRPLRVVRALVLAALILTAMPVSAGAAPPGLPTQAQARNQSLGDLSSTWWQWAVGGWDAQGDCPMSLERGVALMPGSTGGNTTWSGCTVTAGTQLLIPVINFAWSEAEAGPDGDCLIPIDFPADMSMEDRLHACATAVIDTVTAASATVDGRAARPARAHSSVFAWDVPADNPFGVPPGSTTAVADGYWLRLPSLPVGTHEVTVHGSLYLEVYDFTFTVDVSYEITVVPPGQS